MELEIKEDVIGKFIEHSVNGMISQVLNIIDGVIWYKHIHTGALSTIDDQNIGYWKLLRRKKE